MDESEDDTRFDDISDSQPPIELPAAELSRLVAPIHSDSRMNIIRQKAERNFLVVGLRF